MVERTQTLDIIRATSDRICYLIDLIRAQIRLEQQCSNTSSGLQLHIRANLLKTKSHVLQQTAKELEISAQAIIAASQKTIDRSRELRATSKKGRAEKCDSSYDVL